MIITIIVTIINCFKKKSSKFSPKLSTQCFTLSENIQNKNLVLFVQYSFQISQTFPKNVTNYSNCPKLTKLSHNVLNWPNCFNLSKNVVNYPKTFEIGQKCSTQHKNVLNWPKML